MTSLTPYPHELAAALRWGVLTTARPIEPQPHPDFLARGVVAVVPQWPHQDGVRWFMADGMSELVKPPHSPGDVATLDDGSRWRCKTVEAVKVAEMTEAQAQAWGVERPILSPETMDFGDGVQVPVHPMTGDYADAAKTTWDELHPSHPHADAWAWIATWERVESDAERASRLIDALPPQSAEQQELNREHHRINRWLRSKP